MTDVNSRTKQTNVRGIVASAAKRHVIPNTKRQNTKNKPIHNDFLSLKKSSLKSLFMRSENCPARDKQASLKCS